MLIIWTVLKFLLILLLAILILLLIVLCLKIGVQIQYDEQLSVKLRILCFRYTLLPRKKKAVNIKNFTYKKHQARLLAQEEKEKAAQIKQLEKEKEKKQKEKKPKERTLSITALIRMGCYLLKRIPPRLFHCFSIDIRALCLTVATGDAAKTAIRYGYLSQATAYFLELCNQTTRLNRHASRNTRVSADFLGGKTSINADVIISVRCIRFIPFIIYSLYHFIFIRNQLIAEEKEKKALKEQEEKIMQPHSSI